MISPLREKTKLKADLKRKGKAVTTGQCFKPQMMLGRGSGQGGGGRDKLMYGMELL